MKIGDYVKKKLLGDPFTFSRYAPDIAYGIVLIDGESGEFPYQIRWSTLDRTWTTWENNNPFTPDLLSINVITDPEEIKEAKIALIQ